LNIRKFLSEILRNLLGEYNIRMRLRPSGRKYANRYGQFLSYGRSYHTHVIQQQRRVQPAGKRKSVAVNSPDNAVKRVVDLLDPDMPADPAPVYWKHYHRLFSLLNNRIEIVLLSGNDSIEANHKLKYQSFYWLSQKSCGQLKSKLFF